ncbi:SufE family protein [Arachidicoccus ginsenosidivorans]|jgi:cysteine desulfuration protein SufE|uniref:SufE family protein n=1 Tax=Arachidicoccus ginsenosidivorans TaxID=496057 RepID=A0A5B8VP18_9BACT|nr:SufE family protein [Arachidicoccus ginsenosidivorans]QEC72632.1 SufE family protein [Arachidicoccus ginsenosidivorans]
MGTENTVHKTIEQSQQEIIDEFEFLTDWMDKYEMIIQMGKELPEIDQQYKVPENLIKGCQSQVWLHADFKEGKLFFSADSDALITKGLVALVVRVLSGHSPKEIIASDLHFVDDIGLKSHLSPTRSNGLLSMLKQIKHYAIAFNTLQH